MRWRRPLKEALRLFVGCIFAKRSCTAYAGRGGLAGSLVQLWGSWLWWACGVGLGLVEIDSIRKETSCVRWIEGATLQVMTTTRYLQAG
ncbi:hypothetical protein IG631_12156 [Alternaria alternata]|nr:hypothetical protein IG631_12156 [Alternaria alternata]